MSLKFFFQKKYILWLGTGLDHSLKSSKNTLAQKDRQLAWLEAKDYIAKLSANSLSLSPGVSIGDLNNLEPNFDLYCDQIYF